MTSVTSEEVNYLILRYLQEAGFVHSAFTFAQESFVNRAEIKSSAIPPGMLVTLLQRGLHYMSIEFHLNEDGTEKECTKPYSLLDPHICEKTAAQPIRPTTPIVKTKSPLVTKEYPSGIANNAKEPKKEGGKKRKKDQEANGNGEGAEAGDSMKSTKSSNSTSKRAHVGKSRPEKTVPPSFAKVSVLLGHESEVITCTWNPSRLCNILASASGDGTVRLWTVPGDGVWDPEEARMTARVLEHTPSEEVNADDSGSSSKDVTTMDWSPNGEILATGCYDGKARLWSVDGDLLAVLSQHKGPIFQLQWSPNGKFLVSAGLNPSVAVWDVEKKVLVRSYNHHAAPALDVDWRDSSIFGTCSTDKIVHIYDVEKEDPVLRLAGHTDEVNSIKWSPSGDRLLSSSDDMTSRVWRITRGADGSEWRGDCEFVLNEHIQEIYTSKWANDSVIATASFDGTVKIWDLEAMETPTSSRCVQTLRQHTQPVYAISFSPCGKYLASGSLDAAIYVWKVDEGKVTQGYQGRGGIFEVTWSPSGERLAACTSEKELIVLDIAHS